MNKKKVDPFTTIMVLFGGFGILLMISQIPVGHITKTCEVVSKGTETNHGLFDSEDSMYWIIQDEIRTYKFYVEYEDWNNLDVGDRADFVFSQQTCCGYRVIPRRILLD